jgi:4-diphosphocytidyl-2-C-methyl-D-erythritol kinase
MPESHRGCTLPVQLKLEKRIPVGGGLGGGSSNAAAMLRAVNELFDLGIPLDELARIGAGLGSDVPFLVRGGSAIVEGTGTTLAPHDGVPELHAVLVLPGTSCATAGVYARFDEIGAGPLRRAAVHALAATARAPAPDALFNDLAPATIASAPELAQLIEVVSSLAERPANVSGSGSTLFVLCDDAMHAAFLAETIERTHGIPAIAVRSTAGASRDRGASGLGAR